MSKKLKISILKFLTTFRMCFEPRPNNFIDYFREKLRIFINLGVVEK